MAGAAAALAGHAVAQESGWSAGPVEHLIPTASPDAFLIKASTRIELDTPPVLHVGARRVIGFATASSRKHWGFHATGLRPATTYQLRVSSAGGTTDPWPLRTLPAPGSAPTTLRVLTFTCAGGYEDPPEYAGRSHFIPVASRRALLARAIAFRPDVAIANGDHVYWDQETSFRREGEAIRGFYQKTAGLFDTRAPAHDAKNVKVLGQVGRLQIGNLYGVMLRSTPAWFVRDDHDYFDNDEFFGDHSTFPPDPFRSELADQLQAMFWPEFLGDGNRPVALPGRDVSYGTLRWGRLAEFLMYDCRGHIDISGDGGFVPPAVEDWIRQRSADQDIRHVIQTPSTPFGWTAGKWGEWYPDTLGKDGKLTTELAKPGWRRSWFAQQQRLLEIAGSRGRPSVAFSGDLHALGLGSITRSGDAALGHPVSMLLAGPIGTGDLVFPSAFRGVGAQVATDIRMDTHLAPLEKNGFSIVDITRDSIRFRLFAWRPPAPVAEIATMAPVFDKTLAVSG
jgi:hypothetical protein